MYTQSRHYLDFHIAGFTYWDGLDVMDEMKLGTPVDLKLESDNPYDPNAVALYVKGKKIGFVPGEYNSELSKMMYFGHGDIFEAFINAVHPDKHPERQFRVVVKIKDNRPNV